MQNHSDQSIPRRTFLKGAAGLVATGTAGGSLAQTLLGKPPFTLAWWDGSRMVPAGDLPAGQQSLDQVLVSLRGYGAGALQAIDAIFSVPFGKGVSNLPFTAWTPTGCTQTQFLQPVGSALTYTVRYRQGNSELSAPLALSTGKGALQLREGTYVLAAGKPYWNAYVYDPSQPDAPLRTFDGGPANFQYVVMQIERA